MSRPIYRCVQCGATYNAYDNNFEHPQCPKRKEQKTTTDEHKYEYRTTRVGLYSYVGWRCPCGIGAWHAVGDWEHPMGDPVADWRAHVETVRIQESMKRQEENQVAKRQPNFGWPYITVKIGPNNEPEQPGREWMKAGPEHWDVCTEEELVYTLWAVGTALENKREERKRQEKEQREHRERRHQELARIFGGDDVTFTDLPESAQSAIDYIINKELFPAEADPADVVEEREGE